jgi:creatinine amidohydrolase/Fe(II)-dependent formamide hydrolase-like protein
MRTDAERLRLFCELVAKARGRRAITGPTIEAGFTLHFGRFEGLAVETQLGDEDAA